MANHVSLYKFGQIVSGTPIDDQGKASNEDMRKIAVSFGRIRRASDRLAALGILEARMRTAINDHDLYQARFFLMCSETVIGGEI